MQISITELELYWWFYFAGIGIRISGNGLGCGFLFSQLAVHSTWIKDSPKKAESREMVRMVKLCCPLSHLVTSLGRFPKAFANSSFDNLRSVIKSLMRFDRAISKSTSCCMFAGTDESICWKEVFIDFIGQRSCRSLFCFLSLWWFHFPYLLLSVCQSSCFAHS